MSKEAMYLRTEPSELVEHALHDLEDELYEASKEERRTVYEALLDNLCHMLLIDGGPTFGLKVLEKGCSELRNWEEQRGRKELGPFLTKAHRDTLLASPGRYLRQDIEIAGPKRWKVTDGYYG